MKNVILASVLAFGVSAFAQEHTAPAATDTKAPAAEATPAPEASKEAKKAAKHAGHKKADKKKVEAGK